MYNWGYNPLTKWDEPPSIPIYFAEDWLGSNFDQTIHQTASCRWLIPYPSHQKLGIHGYQLNQHFRGLNPTFSIVKPSQSSQIGVKSPIFNGYIQLYIFFDGQTTICHLVGGVPTSPL